MATSPTRLYLHHVLQRARLACRGSITTACAQQGEFICIPEPEVGICWRLVQQKGHTVGLLLV